MLKDAKHPSFVRVIQGFDVTLPGNGRGKRHLFSNDLVLERYDDSVPGASVIDAQTTVNAMVDAAPIWLVGS